MVATVAPPSDGGGGLCLKDTTESETGILQAPTLTYTSEQILKVTQNEIGYVQILHWASRCLRGACL